MHGIILSKDIKMYNAIYQDKKLIFYLFTFIQNYGNNEDKDKIIESSKLFFRDNIVNELVYHEDMHNHFYINNQFEKTLFSVIKNSFVLEKNKIVAKEKFLFVIFPGAYPSTEFIYKYYQLIQKSKKIILIDNKDTPWFAVINVKKLIESKNLFEHDLTFKNIIQHNTEYVNDEAGLEWYNTNHTNSIYIGANNTFSSLFGKNTYLYNTEDYYVKTNLTNDLTTGKYVCNNGDKENLFLDFEELGKMIEQKDLYFDTFCFVSAGFYPFYVLQKLKYTGKQTIVFYDINNSSVIFRDYMLAHWKGPKYVPFNNFVFNAVGKNYFASSLLGLENGKDPHSFFKNNVQDPKFLKHQATLWRKELEKWKSVDDFQEIFEIVRHAAYNGKVKFVTCDITSRDGIEKINFYANNTKDTTTFIWTSNIFDYKSLLENLNYQNVLSGQGYDCENNIDIALFKKFKDDYIKSFKGKYMSFGTLSYTCTDDIDFNYLPRIYKTRGFVTNINLDHNIKNLK